MTLIKSTLSSQLESVLTQKPSLEEAALGWANAYVAYASASMSSLGSLATNGAANVGILQGAFTSAFQSQSAAGAAGAIAGGVMSFWSATVWVGPSAAGSTVVPGNMGLAAELISIFEDTDEKTEADKASALADAFDTGAKLVTVLDVLFVQPAPPVAAPIS